MSVTINAKGTSVSSFAVGKNGTTITQSGTISPPAASDLIVSLDVDQNLVVDAGVSGPALITATNSQDLHINPAVGGGQYLIINATRWPTTTGASGQTLISNGAGVLSWQDAPGVGTVTSVSVTTANGVSGSVATSTSTPAITLSLGAITPTSVVSSGTITGSNFTGSSSGTNTGDQTITLTGDVTGTGTGSFAVALATVNSNIGQFAVQTVNAKGLVTAATNLAATGDATGTSSGAGIALTLATVNSSPQTDTFRKVTVNGKGLVTATSAVTTSDITSLVDGTYVNVTGDTMSGDLRLNNSVYLSGKTVAGTTTRMMGINGSNDIYLGSIDTATGGDWIFTNGAERMRISSNGNIGIAKTPSSRLDVGITDNGGITISNTADTHTGFLYFSDTTAASGSVSYDHSNNAMRFWTNGSEKVRIDSSGNMGIGVVSPSVKLDVNGSAQLRAGGNFSLFNSDTSNYYYLNNPGATGSGNAILAIYQGGVGERMRIDSAGNVGIGKTASGAMLDVNGSVSTRGVGFFYNQASSTRMGYIANPFMATGSGNTTDLYLIADTNMLFGTGGANEYMRITSAGNVGIGTTGPSQKLDVIGGLRVGSTATLGSALPSGVFSYESGAFREYIGDGTGYSRRFSKRSGSVTTDFITITDTGDMTSTGSITASTFNATSTARVKDAIVDISKSYLDKFDLLKPREYDRTDSSAHEFGFIAEEMADVYPEVVGRDSDGIPSGIDYGKLSTILTAKVQEQQNVINELKSQMSAVLALLKMVV